MVVSTAGLSSTTTTVQCEPLYLCIYIYGGHNIPKTEIEHSKFNVPEQVNFFYLISPK